MGAVEAQAQEDLAVEAQAAQEDLAVEAHAAEDQCDTIPLALRVVAKKIPALLDLVLGRQQRARKIASRSVLSNVIVLRWITWTQMDGVTGTVRCARNRNMTVGRVGRTTRRVHEGA